MRKGLSPIISAILVLLIAISVTLLAIIWLPRFTLNILSQLGFNESYTRSRGCLSIENVKGLFGFFTVKNCGKIALSSFKLFIDNKFINNLNIGTLEPSQYIDFYDMPITGGEHDLYITADNAESQYYHVKVPYWECIGGEPILSEDWYVSKNIQCICSYNTIIPAMNVYIIGNGSLSLYNCILQIQDMRIEDNGFFNFTKSTLISPSGGNIAFQGDSEAYIKNSFFNNVQSRFEYASNVTIIDSRIHDLYISSNIHHRLPISNFDATSSPITGYIKAEDSNFTLNLTNVSFDYSVLQISDDSNTTLSNTKFNDFYIASEQTHNLAINGWNEWSTQNLNFMAQGSNFRLDAQTFYGGWTLFYGNGNSNNTVTNSIIGQIEAYGSPNNTFINCSAGTVYLSDSSINVFKNCNINDLNFGYSWYNADNFAKVNFSNTTLSNSITFYNYPSRTTNITFFGNVTFDSSAYINRFYANVTRNLPTMIKDSGNSVIPTMQPANISLIDKFNNSIWQYPVSGGSLGTYYFENPIIVFNKTNYGPGNFTMKVSQVCENKTDLNFLNSTPIEFTINRSYNYDGTNFNTPEVTGTKHGIAFDNSNFWISSSNGNVSKYTSTGTYVSSFNSTLNGLRDVASNGTYLWLLNYNNSDRRVYGYLPSGSYNNFNFDVSSQVSEPYAVDFDGENFWVLGNTSVYKYSSTGSYTGFSFSLSRLQTPLSYPDIVFNGGLWILTDTYSSSSGRGVFKYNPDGTYDNWYFDINPPTASGRGLAYNGTYFWVMNSTGTVFRYSFNKNCLEVMKQCDEFITFLPYTISKSNARYCLLYNLYLPNKTAITFSGAQNSTLDCQWYNLNGNDAVGSVGINFGSTNNNTIINCNVTNFDIGIYGGSSINNFINNVTTSSNSYGIYFDSSLNLSIRNIKSFNNVNGGLFFWKTNNTKIVNVSSYSNNDGIWFHTSYKNDVKNSSFSNNNFADYYLSNSETNNFTSTNFTDLRKIYLEDTTSWFNYNNETTGNIWLKTRVSPQALITRKLLNWDDALMQWNDSTSTAVTATYNITGLLPNTNYSVYNNSIQISGSPFNLSSAGQVSFTINLPANQNISIIVNRSSNVINFHFNEANGTNVFDSSDYKNNGVFSGETFNDGTYYGETFSDGTFVNNPLRVDGKYGKALQNDGNNNYVNINNNPSIDFTSNFTISAWFYVQKLYGSTNYNTILSKRTDETLNNRLKYALFYYNASSELEFYINTSLNYTYVSYPVSVGNWYHVAGVYNGTHIILYVNGSPSTPKNIYGTLLTSTKPLLIGSWDGWACFNGTIDELRMWNRSLSQAEIQAEMNSSLPVSRPVASYSFEEPASATYVNDTHIRVNGTYGSALSFDGMNDYLNAGNSGILNPNYITIMAWIYPLGNNTQNEGRIIGKIDWTNKEGYLLHWYNDTQRIWLAIGNGTTWTQNWSSSNTAPRNQWTHVVGTYDGSNVKIYINGVLNASTPSSGVIAPNINNLMIGSESPGYKRFNGTIDEVRMWNRALSQAEIQSEMWSSLPVSRSLASYRFEESGNYTNDTHIWVNGTYGSALSFDGYNDYVNFGNDASLNTTSLTVMFWLNLSSNPDCDGNNNWRSLIRKGSTGGTSTGWDVILEDNRDLQFDIGNGTAWQNRIRGGTVPVNNWTHLAFVYDRDTGSQIIYKNGFSIASGTVRGYMQPNSQPVQLSHGSKAYCPDQDGYIDGTVDEVRIWNKALNSTEINAEMNRG